MAFIEWSDQLSVNNIAIDSEHKKLVNITNKLHEAMSKGEGSKVMENILTELIIYTKTHFANEEKLMRANNYKDLDEHITQHKSFVNEVNKFYTNFKSGSFTISISVLNFLKNWLIDHIQGSDKKYGMSVAK